MQLKTMSLKSINIFILLFLSSVFVLQAQRTKIDGVAVVVGKNVVLDSDIEKFKQEVEIRSEGKISISDCEMLEELMQQKLLAHHAVIDSVIVSQAEVDDRVNRSIQFFKQEYGSEEKVVKAYGFDNVVDLRDELARVQKENLLREKEQNKITETIDVTPEEVRLYFKGLEDSNELPEFPAEVQLAQIVMYAEPTAEEENRIQDKLVEIKKQVEDGANFKLKAIINSDDPSVAQNGGNMGDLTKDSPFIKEFKEVAFSLEEGQISDPFKTIFGYHIVYLHKIKGNARNVSHILMQPEIDDIKLEQTKMAIENLKKDINNGQITFSDAVKKYSEDKETKNNGGLLVNPYTGESSFDLTRMDPALYGRINELNEGELSDVFYDETRGGEKMYKMILMQKKTDTHTADLVDDYEKIQKLALLKKKEEFIADWSEEKIDETYIKLSKDHKKCTFKSDWKKEK